MEGIKTDEQIRESQVDRVIGFLERIDAYNYFAKLRRKLDQNELVDFEQLEDFLVRINGIARDIPIAERSIDGEGVHLEGFGDSASVPEHIDKIPLLKSAYDSLVKLPNKEDAPYLLPLVINAIHLFADGNGRTARIMNLLLKDHHSKEEFDEEMKKALSIDGRFDVPSISTEFISMDVMKIVLANHGVMFGTENNGWDPLPPAEVTHYWASALRPKSPEGKNFMKLLKEDYEFSFVVACNFLKQKGLIEQAVVDYGNEQDGPRIMLSPEKMDEILKPEDWEGLVDNLNSMKREKVDIMIGAFVEPEHYRTVDGGETLRDGFIRRVVEEYENNKRLYSKDSVD